ncbi:adenylosuccinate synthase [Limosilactobacillus panis]|nr:adenylosuccinate synthase [Limosilactobacillus panis]
MSSVVIVGSQWGDEGKGKMTDYLSQNADVVVRSQGGNNAGHTIAFNGKKFALRLVPSGIFGKDKLVVIGNGVVINPPALLKELHYLQDNGIDTSGLRISSRSHVTFPYHILLDKCQEKAKGDHKVGTTKNGIGPTYMDKVSRVGIRMCDLLEKDTFKIKLQRNLAEKNELFTKLYHVDPINFDDIFESYYEYGQELKKYVTDTARIVNDAVDDGKRVLFEGAQGVMLDVDQGTYPYVTASNPIAGGVCTGVGIGPNKIDTVVGICKAYSTRVGAGPFPSELTDEVGDQIRETGHEYGTVTGRPRRVGWFDSVAMRHARRVSGLSCLSLNLLDVLTGLKTIKICKAYKLDGKEIDYYPASLKELERCEPVYDELPGWDEDITGVKKFEDLPENAQNYLKRVSELSNVPVATVSVGADRIQTIIVKDPWDIAEK